MADVEREILLKANLLSFSKPILKFCRYISLRIQKVAFSIASDNDHTHVADAYAAAG